MRLFRKRRKLAKSEDPVLSRARLDRELQRYRAECERMFDYDRAELLGREF